jgi:DNA-directed RNA polymerase subunit K/omega
MSLKPIDISRLEGTAENIYEAIVVMSRRARQINEDVKIQLNQRLEMLSTGVESEEETEVNPDQLIVSLEFEQLPKATSLAIGEMLDGKLQFRYKDKDTQEKT